MRTYSYLVDLDQDEWFIMVHLHTPKPRDFVCELMRQYVKTRYGKTCEPFTYPHFITQQEPCTLITTLDHPLMAQAMATFDIMLWGWCSECFRQLIVRYSGTCDVCDPKHGDPLIQGQKPIPCVFAYKELFYDPYNNIHPIGEIETTPSLCSFCLTNETTEPCCVACSKQQNLEDHSPYTELVDTDTYPKLETHTRKTYATYTQHEPTPHEAT